MMYFCSIRCGSLDIRNFFNDRKIALLGGNILKSRISLSKGALKKIWENSPHNSEQEEVCI